MPKRIVLPSLGDLSSDSDERYAQLDGRIRELRGMRTKNVLEGEAVALRIRDATLVSLANQKIPHDYVCEEDTDGDGKIHDDDLLLEFPASIIAVHSPKKIAEEKLEAILDRLDPIAKAEDEYDEIVLAHDAFMEDFVSRYSLIRALRQEDLSKSNYVVALDYRNGAIALGVSPGYHETEVLESCDDMTREECSTQTYRDLVVAKHAHCTHNLYIIEHPSDLVELSDYEDLVAAALLFRTKKMYPDYVRPDAPAAKKDDAGDPLKSEKAAARGVFLPLSGKKPTDKKEKPN